jgi:hypothetical protein
MTLTLEYELHGANWAMLSERQLFVCGGIDSRACFEVEVGKDDILPRSEMSRKRQYHAIHGFGVFVYIFGGFDTDDQVGVIDSVDRYDTGKDCWQNVPKLPIRASRASATRMYDKLYIASECRERSRNSVHSPLNTLLLACEC